MNPLRTTLVVILVAATAYLGYVKTRSVAVPGSAAPEQHQNQQLPKISPGSSAVPPKSLAEPVAASSPNITSAQESNDREKLDQEIITRAKAAKLSDLEKGMPEQTFGDWLESNFADKAKISWEVNDCGENDGGGQQDELPVCAEADLNFPKGEQIGISVAVASVKVGTGIHTFGPAGLFYTFYTSDNKKSCSATLDRIARWAKGSLQEPPCTPER